MGWENPWRRTVSWTWRASRFIPTVKVSNDDGRIHSVAACLPSEGIITKPTPSPETPSAGAISLIGHHDAVEIRHLSNKARSGQSIDSMDAGKGVPGRSSILQR